ncbi:MAG: DNA polymerase I [Clostridiales bacterium]|nr:DNA polymerase I [Clostridiales bacterium]
MENFFIIDGNSLINRAFYALPLLTNKDGEYSNAVYGFCNILTKLITENKVDKVLVAFDLKAKTFRHLMYADYKAQRKGMPQELASQMPILKEMLKLMQIPILELEGYEADDIIGTLAQNKSTKNYIITGDKDSLQLINDNTEVWLTRKGISEIEKFDKEHFVEVYGLNPIKMIDLKALMGDSSDNIPGVKGIGEKTALNLLHEYNSVENIYNNINEIKGKLQEKLISDKEMCFLSKTLATINTLVPIEFDLNKANLSFPFNNNVAEFFNKYQFKTLLNKANLFAESIVSIQENRKVKVNEIKTKQEIDQLLNDLRNNYPFTIYFDSNIHISNSAYEENIIILKQDLLSEGFSYEEILKILKPILENKNIEKILFEIKPLKHNLEEYNINLNGEIFDIVLADYLLKSGKKPVKNVLELCEELLFDKNNIASCMFFAYKHFKSSIDKKDMTVLYNNIEFPLINVLYSMEKYGFKLDYNTLLLLNSEYEEELKRLNNQIIELAGENFNVNSPKQLADILFSKLNLPNKAKNSTNIEVLESLSNIHPIINLIIRYRKINKLNSTYIVSYLEKIDKNTHLVHTVFNQMLTQTGRLSSTEPNLQNIPIREEEGRNLRKIFISSFENGKIISADYSQIELRLLAHFSEDDKLIYAFNNNVDIHQDTASKIFNVPLEFVNNDMRRRAKAVNFGIIYGISDYGLSQSIHSTRKEAKEFIERYFISYPKVKKYMNSSIEFAKNNGFVKSLYNRRRVIDELNSNNYNLKQFGERVALNMPLQGTASDIIKLAMIQIYDEFKKLNLKSKLILQIHDELIVDAESSEIEIIKKILKEKMENVVKLLIPLEVNISVGDSLFDAKE